MAPLLFFLAGLPAALLADYAIRALSRSRSDDDESEAADAAGTRTLPWQEGRWPDRVRLLVVACIPALMAVAGWRFEPLQAALVSVFLVALLVCTGTDLIDFRVPNVVTYPATALALAAALVLPDGNVVSGAIAALLGGGIFLVMAVITRGGLGLGDVKLAVLIGAALGFPTAYQAFALGVVAGGIAIAILFFGGVVSRRQAVPYAPFLALAATAMLLANGAVFAPL
jgi:prepilin signal peptidase PulO-like enzyme (type II secretory pathway)